MKTDVTIIGGGIVGLATAYQITEAHPRLKIAVLEKESSLGQHQTGHNSGVLHSGIYYRPGSLKAVNCREGKRAMESFCREQGIAHEICGKVIVAVDENELPTLERIYERGRQNGIQCELIDRQRLAQLEPYAAGVRGIHVPEAGIVNFRHVCERLAEIVRQRGGQIVVGTRLLGTHRDNLDLVLQTNTAEEIRTRYAINCAGLYCDRVAKMSGQQAEAQIVPFRGEYYQLKPDYHYFCRNLIYPVPDPNFPFLGVHFTRMIDGTVECGPNAVLAFAREGYRKWDVNLYDLTQSLTYPGFIRLALKYWKVGLGEMWRSLNKAAFVKALQRLIPEVRSKHLVPTRAGVRAQAIAVDGSMVDDFLIQTSERIINVCNAPSPAATSSLNIGKMIVERLSAQL